MVNIGALVNPSFAWIKKELCLDKKEICLDKIFAPAPGSQCPRKGTFILLTIVSAGLVYTTSCLARTCISAVSPIPFHEQDRLHDGCQLHVDDNDVLRVFLLCHFVGSFTHQEGIRRLIYNERQI